MSDAEPNQVMPAMSAEAFADLKASIARFGVLVPIEVDEDGVIVDGHHRARALRELGVPEDEWPVFRREFGGGSAAADARLAHVVALNLSRRHLTDAQRVLLGETLAPSIASEARHRHGPKSPQPQGRTRDLVARAVGIGSGLTFERGRRVIEQVRRELPEIMPELQDGSRTIREARAMLNARRRRQQVRWDPDKPDLGAADIDEALDLASLASGDGADGSPELPSWATDVGPGRRDPEAEDDIMVQLVTRWRLPNPAMRTRTMANGSVRDYAREPVPGVAGRPEDRGSLHREQVAELVGKLTVLESEESLREFCALAGLRLFGHLRRHIGTVPAPDD